jgi:hypothetical protein
MCAASASCKKLFHFYWDMVKQPLFNLPSEANFFHFLLCFLSLPYHPPYPVVIYFQKITSRDLPLLFSSKKNHLKHLHVLPCLSAIELPTA